MQLFFGSSYAYRGSEERQEKEKLALSREKSAYAPDDYLVLIRQFPLVSINSDVELDGAIKMLDSRLTRGPLSEGEEQYLGALTDLVEHYEEHRVKIDAPKEGAMLRHLMDSHGVSQAELSRDTGIYTSTFSEVLKDKRTLSHRNIQKVCERFKVSTSLFADIRRYFYLIA